MNSANKPETPPLAILKILWAAITLASGMIALVGFIRYGEPVFEGVSPPPLALAEAIFALTLSFVVPRFMLKAAKAKLPNAASFDVLAKAYTVPFVVRLAFTELVALSGLIASVYTKTNLTIPFVATAVFRLIIAFPTEDKIKDVFSRFE